MSGSVVQLLVSVMILSSEREPEFCYFYREEGLY